MVHVLASALEVLNNDNPRGLPCIKGWNIIGGQLSSSSDGATFTSTNPANHSDILGEFPLSSRDDVSAALDAAHAAFPDWS